MATDLTGLHALVRSVREFAAGAGVQEIAQVVLERLQATAAAGTTPDGEPWAPRKQDGARTMVNAAKDLSVAVRGTIVLVTLAGNSVFHHYGAGRGRAQGKPRRPVIPTAGLPATLGLAIRDGLVTTWNREIAKARRGG